MKIHEVPKDNKYGCFTTYYHKEYNMFSFPCTELHKLYLNMCNSFKSILRPGEQYYINCWTNLFDKEKNIEWHAHWPAEYKAYHGFYCVNTEGENESYTDYKIPNQKNIYRVKSLNGLCVIGKSEGDEHRSSPWLNDGKYRVTIAFDIIPISSIKNKDEFPNNFVPLVI
jgi:hypothetical protein